MEGVRQPVIVGGSPAERAAVGVELLEDCHRFARTIEVQRIPCELLLPELRAWSRLHQCMGESVGAGKITATAAHLPIDLHLFQLRQMEPRKAAGERLRRIALPERL